MAEVDRLIGMLKASAANLSSYDSKTFDCGLSSLSPLVEQDFSGSDTSSTDCAPVPSSFLEALELVADQGPLPARPSESLSQNFKVGLNHVLSTLNAIFPPGANLPAPISQVKETTRDITNDLAIANCKRIFSAASNPDELSNIAIDLSISTPTETMADRLPMLSTSNLSPASAADAASPARGTAMLSSIFKSVRVPEFRFRWQFWAEKGQQSSTAKTTSLDELASRPKPLGEEIISVKEFYQHFNNIPVENLKLRDSIHLFHLGVKPLWEDPRNEKGGAYYFRVSKEQAPAFWHEMCLLSVGDVLQGAVETQRKSKFSMPTCAILFSHLQIMIWLTDA
jgi:hypothetical protein